MGSQESLHAGAPIARRGHATSRARLHQHLGRLPTAGAQRRQPFDAATYHDPHEQVSRWATKERVQTRATRSWKHREHVALVLGGSQLLGARSAAKVEYCPLELSTAHGPRILQARSDRTIEGNNARRRGAERYSLQYADAFATVCDKLAAEATLSLRAILPGPWIGVSRTVDGTGCGWPARWMRLV